MKLTWKTIVLATSFGFFTLSGVTQDAASAAVMKQVLDDPIVKSRLAIALSKGAKVPYAQAAAKVGAYASSTSIPY